MNAFTDALVWSALQISLFSILIAAMLLVARRWFSGILGEFLAIAMTLILGFTLLAIAPIPSWIPSKTTAAKPLIEKSKSIQKTNRQPISFQNSAQHPPATQMPTSEDITPEWAITINRWWNDVKRTAASDATNELDSSVKNATAAPLPFPWIGLIASCMLAAIALGLSKLTVGLVAINRLKKNRIELDDHNLLNFLEQLKTEMGISKQIEISTTKDLSTAATVGWLRPIILLPDDWSHWSRAELSSAVSHELAHVAGNDYLKNLIAQASVAINFFNPLVHWLGKELRVAQELLADSRAAVANGGQQTYLLTMAEMALRQDQNQLGWLAQPFLPTRTTFLRRIEMLKGEKKLRGSKNRVANWLARLTVVGVALICIGFRMPSAETVANQTDRVTSEITKPEGTVDAANKLEFVGDRALIFAAIEFSKNASDPNSIEALIRRWLKRWQRMADWSFFDMDKASMVTIQQLDSNGLGFVVHMNGPMSTDLPKCERFMHRGVNCLDTGGVCVHFPDNSTIVFGTDRNTLRAMLDAGKNGLVTSKWHEAAETVLDDQLVFAITQLGSEFYPEFRGEVEELQLELLSPLWTNVQFTVAGLQFNESDITMHFHTEADSEANCKIVQDTLLAATILSRNLFRRQSKLIAENDPKLDDKQQMLQLGIEAIGNSQISADGTSVRLETKLGLLTNDFIVLLNSLAEDSRRAVSTVQSFNNLRMLSAAMLNYEFTYGHLPGTSMTARNSEHPYSWRIAILPFIEGEQDLYNRYRFDEPWDSEHNSLVTVEMPSIFGHSAQPNNATDSSVYVFSSPQTMFPVDKQLGHEDIPDGTANTIALIQAKRESHWAKPEDIALDGSGAAQLEALEEQLMAYSNAIVFARADGSVSSMKEFDTETLLRRILIDDEK